MSAVINFSQKYYNLLPILIFQNKSVSSIGKCSIRFFQYTHSVFLQEICVSDQLNFLHLHLMQLYYFEELSSIFNILNLYNIKKHLAYCFIE